MKNCSALIVLALVGLGLANPIPADEKPTPVNSGYRVLAQDRGRVAIVNAKGEVEWEVACPFGSHDIALLPNGNLLLHTGPTTIVEMTPAKKVVWKHESRAQGGLQGQVEIHAFQRLDDGLTMIAESGNRRIIEVDKDDKIVHEVPLTVDKPNSHRDTRLARKLANGHYLVCHEGDGVVREYDDKGKVVWSYTLDLGGRPASPATVRKGTAPRFSVLCDGTTATRLIAAGNGNRVIEVNPEGKIVWSIGHDELPGIRLAWVTTLQVLPNGNLIVGNCHAGPDNPQLFEVTRDKKVVWTFKDFKTFGNSLAAAQVLDIKGKIGR